MIRNAAVLMFAANILYLFATLDQLPEPLAVHFDIAGLPNGWMSHTTHASLMLGLVALFALIPFGLAPLSRRFPRAFAGIPQRDFWLEPSHRHDLQELVARFSHKVALLMGGFLLYIQHLTVKANLSKPIRLDTDALLWGTGSFVLALLVLSVLWYLRLRRR